MYFLLISLYILWGGEYLAKRKNESDEEYKARMRVNARRYLSTPEGKAKKKEY